MDELFWADVLLYCHFLYVLAVVLPVPLILVGYGQEWNWIRNLWLRSIHLGMIGVVAILALLNIPCPLTEWESRLRVRAGQAGYVGFLQTWAARLLYYDFEPWFFTLMYVAFAGVVLALWIWIPPSFRRGADQGSQTQ